MTEPPTDPLIAAAEKWRGVEIEAFDEDAAMRCGDLKREIDAAIAESKRIVSNAKAAAMASIAEFLPRAAAHQERLEAAKADVVAALGRWLTQRELVGWEPAVKSADGRRAIVLRSAGVSVTITDPAAAMAWATEAIPDETEAALTGALTTLVAQYARKNPNETIPGATVTERRVVA